MADHPTSPARTAWTPGAVTLIQRFGSAANLNIHLHCLVLDGVYRNSEGAAIFHEVPAPTIEELHDLLAKIITRIRRLLTKQGFLIAEQGTTYLAEADRESALLPLQAASRGRNGGVRSCDHAFVADSFEKSDDFCIANISSNTDQLGITHRSKVAISTSVDKQSRVLRHNPSAAEPQLLRMV